MERKNQLGEGKNSAKNVAKLGFLCICRLSAAWKSHEKVFFFFFFFFFFSRSGIVMEFVKSDKSHRFFEY